MGNSTTVPVEEDQLITKKLFNLVEIIGRGGFGRVWKVEHKKSQKIYAMKEMSKIRIVSKRSVNSVMNERKLLAVVRHPFIVNMEYAFQDRENLYLAMDLMTGGDLRYHLVRARQFTEEQTRFFVACIVTGLEYLHVNKIIHRDVKPENLVLDNKGYLRITDFGISSVIAKEILDSSGTPGYMAPEVLFRQSHGIASDYFGVGVIAFEFMTGRRPYLGRNRKDIKDAIVAKQVQLKRSDIPKGWSFEAADFINKLIQRKPENRLGFGGPQEVKNHAWLSDFPWKKLFEKTLEAPLKPEDDDNYSVPTGFGFKDESESSFNLNSLQDLFEGYYFDGRRKPNKEDITTLERPKCRVHNTLVD